MPQFHCMHADGILLYCEVKSQQDFSSIWKWFDLNLQINISKCNYIIRFRKNSSIQPTSPLLIYNKHITKGAECMLYRKFAPLATAEILKQLYVIFLCVCPHLKYAVTVGIPIISLISKQTDCRSISTFFYSEI